MFTFLEKPLNLLDFGRKDEGSASIEALIMMPLVFWFYVAMFSFFQTYQEYNLNQKAAHTIGDMISRETMPLDNSYLDGVQDLLDYMTHSSEVSTVRITSVQWNENDKRFYIHWSKARGNRLPLSDADVMEWESRIPKLSDGEFIVVTETWTAYDPPFNVGLGQQGIENFVFTRPRYAPRVLFNEAA